jgi:Ca2+-binding RTX toxin-like protein
MRHWGRKAAVAGIASLCALALAPAAASAGEVTIRMQQVTYTDEGEEANNLTISLSGPDYTLSDSGAAISSPADCFATSPPGPTATCPSAGIVGITVRAGAGADSVTNDTSTPSTLFGGDGDDSLQGGAGNDVLRGNEGVDSVAGGAGDDSIDVQGNRADVVSCGEGNDTVLANASDAVSPDCENVDRGGDPPPPPPGPRSDPSPPAASLLGPAETRALDPGACAREILGTAGNDRLDGTALGDSLFGMQGNDLLRGVQGDDCVFGGVGFDRLGGGLGDDRLLGDDSRSGVGGNDRLSGDAGHDLLVGGPGNDDLSGNEGNDRLSRGPGNDRLSGGPGSDGLSGGRGRNRLFGGSGNDRLYGVNGRFDLLDCGRGRDRAWADRVDRVRRCERVKRRR